jgi:hypothetical protein
MSNILPNGTVLPSGLLGSHGREANVAAFNHSYRNTGLKAGFVVKSYAANDPANKSTLCTEYDVLTIEQSENKGSTSILYRNCLSSQGFGSIADFLEYTLRPKTFQTSKGFPTFGDQDGAVVLIQCLDNIGDKAIVVGTLIHPERTTTITSTAPQLSGEYNGVNVQIKNDGSCSLTFKGATDSKGAPNGQGNTVFQIKADGSFEFNHSTVTISAEKSGTLTVTSNKDTNITCANANVNASADAKIVAGGECDVTASGNVVIQGSEIHLNGKRGQILTNITDPVIDSIFGEPTMGVPTVKSGN